MDRPTNVGIAIRAAAVTSLLLAGSACPLFADWLVTRDGHRIETRGAWEVEAGRVVFTLPNGTLSSLRVADIDLDASRAATEEARAKASGERDARVEPRRPPVLVLTDADVRRASPRPDSDTGEADAAARGKAAEALLDGQLRLDEWKIVDGSHGDGIRIEGRITNPTEEFATGVFLSVLLYSEDGDLVQAAPAELTSRVLPPGRSAAFRASFRGDISFSYVRFSAEGQTVRAAPEGSIEAYRRAVHRLTLEP